MEEILKFLLGWFIISIPSSLFIGALLARKTRVQVRSLQVSRYVRPLEANEKLVH